MSYIQAKNGRDGNERYIFHFLLFLTEEEKVSEPQSIHKTNNLFNLALRKAKNKGFTARPYNGSNFGGGIVINTNNPDAVINKLKNS